MIPTMTSIQERVCLRDWVALNWDGGDIVEIGAFCGASAVAILQGMALAKRYDYEFHVYDKFEFPEDPMMQMIYRSHAPKVIGHSFREEFDRNTRDLADHCGNAFVVHQGDASAMQSPPSVSLLHLDCAFSKDFHAALAGEFFTKLEIGGTLIQQDYGYRKAPWIAEYMSRLTEYLKPVMQVETSVYFKVKKALTKDVLIAAFT